MLLEWTAKTPGAATYDGDAPRELLRLQQPFNNHNGGLIAFNPLARQGQPDFGMLYIGNADGGSVMETLRRKNRGELPSMAVLAAALEQLGDHAAALTQLERAVRQPDAWLQMYNRSERYESLRRDPRGKAALESIEAW